jgi:hypothetical protein
MITGENYGTGIAFGAQAESHPQRCTSLLLQPASHLPTIHLSIQVSLFEISVRGRDVELQRYFLSFFLLPSCQVAEIKPFPLPPSSHP